jgi:hypothetical protein
LKTIINKEADLDKLLDSKDKKNVSTAVKLLNLRIYFSECRRHFELNPHHLERDVIIIEYQFLGELASLFLSIFKNPLIDLFEQLCNLAILSHYFLYLHVIRQILLLIVCI